MARPQEFNQQKVIGQAIECFWLKGYSETSMSDLLTAMSMSRSSFYNTFGDKRQLFELCLETYGKQAQQVMNMTLGSTRLVGLEAIRQFLTLVLITPMAALSQRGCLLVNTIAESASVDLEINKKAKGLMEPVRQGFIQQLKVLFEDEKSIQHGEWLFTQLLGWRLQAQLGLSSEEIAKQIDWSLNQLEQSVKNNGNKKLK